MIEFHYRTWTDECDREDYNKIQWTVFRPLQSLINIGNSIIRINGIVYENDTEKFEKAFEKERMWEKLNK